MENTISIIATAEGTEKKVTFKIIKKNKISADVYLGDENVGEMHINISDFNDFCLDLFSMHKKIMAEEKYVIRDIEISNPKFEMRGHESFLIGGDITFKNGMKIGNVDKENTYSIGTSGTMGPHGVQE